MKKPYLYFAVFSSGMTTLAIEFSASRLLGSVFGTSNLVWASIIGLILIYLTLGYFLGGKIADKKPTFKMFYTLMAWGAFTAGIVPFVSRPILRLAASAFDDLQIGVLFGSFTSVMVLFIIPVTLLGTVSPFAIRLAIQDPKEAGRISGRIYAISTLGSFIGTFLPVLLMIPTIGTRNTFVVFSGYLVFVAIIGMFMSVGWRSGLTYLWMLVFLVLLGIIWGNSPIKRSTGQIYESESAYNYIQVLEKDGYRFLRLNEGQGVHSEYHPVILDYHGSWMQVLSGPFFNESPYEMNNIKNMAIIGLAGGTIARQATAVFGEISIDGYEIDPQIINVGRRYFGMNMPNLNAIAADGRWGLAHSHDKYSIISIDAYRPPYIPWHLTTQEYFQIVHDHLTKDGVLVINVGRAPNDRRLINGLIGTISTIFPSIYVMDVPYTFNSVIYATVQSTNVMNLFNNYVVLKEDPSTHPLLVESMERTLMNITDTPASEVVFTDDRAPIEWITNGMVLKYVLSGNLEDLQ
ncbi:MAG: fused MFS/spermidine synthase [Anaerolineales bacterium]|nr:fused MFS/spermidine synthase [Anaerolineales bacterium]